MRKLLWFTVGLAAATALYAYCFSGTILMILALVCIPVGAFLIWIPNSVCKVTAFVLLGLGFGFGYCQGYESVLLSGAKQLDEKTRNVSVEATDYSFYTDFSYAVDGKVTIDGKEYKLRLYLENGENIKPGDVLKGNVEFRYTAEGAKKGSTYHKGEGIFLLGYGEEEISITPCKQIPDRYFAAVLRKTISNQISSLFPEDTASFARALLLGDDSDISFADNIAFQRSGIRHVIAVSGLHVSILFSVVYSFTGRRRLLTLLLGLPVLGIFAAIAGFTPSVVRACVMQALVILGMAVDKEYDRSTALAFAVLCMLIGNPLTVTSVSLQLSVGSMIGIFLFSDPIRRYFMDEKRLGKIKRKTTKGRLIRWLVGSISVSVSAMSVTLPLCAIYFGAVSVIGIVTNLLTLWIITYIFIGIVLACILSSVWLPLGMFAAYIVAWPIRYVLWTARLLSRIPFGSLYTESPYTILWLMVTFVLTILFLLCKKRPVIMFSVAVAAFYLVSAAGAWLEPVMNQYYVSVLDVGQGQCVLVQCKNKVYMVDCGSRSGENAATVAHNALAARGIHRLDGLILTHYDSDHCNGISYLIDVMDVDMLYLPDTEPKNKYREILEQTDIPILWIDKEQTFSCGNGSISIFPAETKQKGNESSLCILFQAENCDILITGDRDTDGEEQLLWQYDIPDIEVLVAGHHGAATSTGVTLLNKTHPEVVVISVGADNRHEHPDAETIDRLNQIGCVVRRTDLEGTITIRG